MLDFIPVDSPSQQSHPEYMETIGEVRGMLSAVVGLHSVEHFRGGGGHHIPLTSPTGPLCMPLGLLSSQGYSLAWPLEP